MFNKVSEYINDPKFRVIIYEDKIQIINYQKIISIEDTYISFLTRTKKIIVNGTNLTVNKLVSDEMLIKGNINKIEVKDA